MPRERWFGATGRRVPEIAVEGELDLDDALVLDDAATRPRCGRPRGGPAGGRAGGEPGGGAEALSHPEVSSRSSRPTGASSSTST